MPGIENNADVGVQQAIQIRNAVAELALPESIGALIEQVATEKGDQTACHIIEQQRSLSYRDLDQQSNRLADSLSKIGVVKSDHIAMLMPNSPEFLIAWLAIAKLGAVVVPVNNSYKASELEYVLSDSKSKYLIIDESCLAAFEGMNQRPAALVDDHIVLLAEQNTTETNWCGFNAMLESGDSTFRGPNPASHSDLLQIQYTSGTTGFPKGCMQTHEYWLLAAFTAFEFTKQFKIENMLSVFPLFYMEAQVNFLLTLVRGGTVYLAKQPSISKLMQWICEYDIHICTFHEVAMKGIPVAEDDADNPLVYVNAFQYKGDSHHVLEQRFNVIGRDAFAMTEIGMGTFVPANATHMVGSGSCGLASPMREMKIVDSEGEEVEQGQSGTLWVRGPGMFLGYYEKPEANAKEFDGDWFCTGDIARQDENGYYYIVGRTKEMIKRSGENIAAREVESVIRELSQISEVAVLAVPDDIRREEVKALVILADGVTSEQCPPSVVIEHCSNRLAQFKVPRYIGYVESFPRTPSNKVAKQQIMDRPVDPRAGAFDRVDKLWR